MPRTWIDRFEFAAVSFGVASVEDDILWGDGVGEVRDTVGRPPIAGELRNRAHLGNFFERSIKVGNAAVKES
jgi:hypothetical protein